MLQNLTRRALFAAFALLTALPVAHAATDQTIRVGIMSAEDEDIWAVVAKEAAKQGLTLKLTVFNDYTQPNEALENGELDANAFQHKPYLDNQIKTRGYHIVPVGYTAVWPIGLYSHKHKSVADLPEGAVIGVPNDPSNEGRALKLLEAQGAIKLKPDAGILANHGGYHRQSEEAGDQRARRRYRRPLDRRSRRGGGEHRLGAEVASDASGPAGDRGGREQPLPQLHRGQGRP